MEQSITWAQEALLPKGWTEGRYHHLRQTALVGYRSVESICHTIYSIWFSELSNQSVRFQIFCSPVLSRSCLKWNSSKLAASCYVCLSQPDFCVPTWILLTYPCQEPRDIRSNERPTWLWPWHREANPQRKYPTSSSMQTSKFLSMHLCKLYLWRWCYKISLSEWVLTKTWFKIYFSMQNALFHCSSCQGIKIDIDSLKEPIVRAMDTITPVFSCVLSRQQQQRTKEIEPYSKIPSQKLCISFQYAHAIRVCWSGPTFHELFF